jgi:L-fuconate dehydratase
LAYAGVSGQVEDRMIEYVDQPHEHLLDPIVIDNERYRVPSRPGSRAQTQPETLLRFAFAAEAKWSAIGKE